MTYFSFLDETSTGIEALTSGPPLQVGTELVNLSVIWELVLVLLYQSGKKKTLINNVCFKRNKDYRKNIQKKLQ